MRSILRYTTGAALLTISCSAVAFAQESADDRSQHPLYFGMTAGIFKRTGDVPNTSTELILLPDQELHLSLALTRRIRAEVPFTLYWTDDDLNGAVSTTVVGAIGDMFLRSSNAGEQSGLFAGTGFTLKRLPTAAGAAYQWGVVGRAGYEFPIGGVLVRAAASYERRFAGDNQPSRNVYGGLVGAGFPIYGERFAIDADREGSTAYGSVLPWYLNFGAALNYMSNGGNHSLTTIDIPSPYIGLFSMLGLQRRLAAGGRATFQYASVGSTTNEHIRLAPRLEYHLSRQNLRKKDLKVSAQMIIDGLSFATVTGSSGGTQVGFGGDVAFTLPRAPTIWNFGVGVDYLMKQPETMRPATTNLRFEIGLDRYLLRR